MKCLFTNKKFEELACFIISLIYCTIYGYITGYHLVAAINFIPIFICIIYINAIINNFNKENRDYYKKYFEVKSLYGAFSWILLYGLLYILFFLETYPLNFGFIVTIYLFIFFYYICSLLGRSKLVKEYKVAFSGIAIIAFISIFMIFGVGDKIVKTAYNLRKASFSMYDYPMAQGENLRMSFKEAGLYIDNKNIKKMAIAHALHQGAYHEDALKNLSIGDNTNVYYWCADIDPNNKENTYNTVLATTDKKTGDFIIFCGLNGNIKIPAKLNSQKQRNLMGNLVINERI